MRFQLIGALFVATVVVAVKLPEDKVELQGVERFHKLASCRDGCHEMAAVTLYKGSGSGETSLKVEDHEIKFSALVLDRRIALTAMSSLEDLVGVNGRESVRICYSYSARPKNGLWTSCGKIRRMVYPAKYKGPGKAFDIGIVKIIDGFLGEPRDKPDRISFNPIPILTVQPQAMGYGAKTEGPPDAEKYIYWGDLWPGSDKLCDFGDEIDKYHYVCLLGEERGESFKPGDEGGPVRFYVATEDGEGFGISGIVTNYKGKYGDIPMVLRFDRPGVESFIRRTVKNMQGELDEWYYYGSFYYNPY